MKKIVLTKTFPEEVIAPYQGKYQFVYPTKEEDMFSQERLQKEVSDADALIVVSVRSKCDRAVVEAAKNLKAVSLMSAGYDHVDTQVLKERGIPLTNAPEFVGEATAELTMAMMLHMVRDLKYSEDGLRETGKCVMEIFPTRGGTLIGKTLGILGLGWIGKGVARRARAFGMNILYHNRHRQSPEVEAQYGATYVSQEELLQKSDVVTLHMPATKDNYHMLSTEQFAMMKPSAYLINTARGTIVDSEALAQALNDGVIAGAALDVFEGEPEVPACLLQAKNAYLLPHIGSASMEIRCNTLRQALEGAMDVLEGREPKHRVL